MKYNIKNGDIVFATGVYLLRDSTVDGGWLVTAFEDNTYHNGILVESENPEPGVINYFIEVEKK